MTFFSSRRIPFANSDLMNSSTILRAKESFFRVMCITKMHKIGVMMLIPRMVRKVGTIRSRRELLLRKRSISGANFLAPRIPQHPLRVFRLQDTLVIVRIAPT